MRDANNFANNKNYKRESVKIVTCTAATAIETNTTSGVVDVHRRNLHIIAFPVIFSFNLLHLLIYQIYCWLCFAFAYASFVFIWFRGKWRQWAASADNSRQESNVIAAASSTAGDIITLYQCERDQQDKEMWKTNDNSASPVSDILLRQKQHHHRAFELISRALKLDEQNVGKI